MAGPFLPHHMEELVLVWFLIFGFHFDPILSLELQQGSAS